METRRDGKWRAALPSCKLSLSISTYHPGHRMYISNFGYDLRKMGHSEFKLSSNYTELTCGHDTITRLFSLQPQ
eukprot:scaffold4407_cov138-Skeletonema_menzelii.AAC.5